MTRRRKKPLKKGKRSGRSVPPYPHEFRLKVAKLYVEDGYPAKLIATQFGISDYCVCTWGKRYREHGEQGLSNQPKTLRGSTKLPESVSKSIADLKKENPGYGERRISDILKWFFLVRTSPSTVQRTLRDQGLTHPAKRKREKTLSSSGFLIFEEHTEWISKGNAGVPQELGLNSSGRKLTAECLLGCQCFRRENPFFVQALYNHLQGGEMVKSIDYRFLSGREGWAPQTFPKGKKEGEKSNRSCYYNFLQFKNRERPAPAGLSH